MKKELYEKEMNYALSLAFISSLLQNDLLTKEEFKGVQIKLRKKYRPIFQYKLADIA